MPDLWTKRQDGTGSPVSMPRLGKILISEDQIARRIRELSEEIVDRYEEPEGPDLVIVAIMTGSLIFLADLIRALPLPIRIGLMMVSNYPGPATWAQGVKIKYDLEEKIEGKDVLVVDDILDTGQTLSTVVDMLRQRNPRSIRTCVFLDKQIDKPKLIAADFMGFEIPDRFVVGYGLDYDNLYRNYPQIAVLEF